VRVTALKSVDFPTFGRPTIPALNMISVAAICDRRDQRRSPSIAQLNRAGGI
jgi:hypothetical protein